MRYRRRVTDAVATAPATDAPPLPNSELAKLVFEATQHARIGTAIVSRNGETLRILHINDVGVEILGFSREELLARPPFANVAPEDVSRLVELFLEWRKTDKSTISYEASVIHANGTRVPIEITSCRTVVDGAHYSISFFRDITERVEARRVVEESEARFRRFIEAAPDGIAISRNGFFLYANPKALVLLGVATVDELRKTPIQALLSPEDLRTMNERIGPMVNEGKTFTPREYRSLRGERATVEITSIPIDFEGGPAIMGFARDVTERKALQARLSRIDRLASLGTLTAGVAHEVNNPLSVTSLSLEAIGRALEAGTGKEEMKALLTQAKGGIDRIAAIVRDLRGFSRRDEAMRPVDVKRVLESASSMVANELRHRATFTLECEQLPPVDTSEGRLEQVVMNLLLNAAQAFEAADPKRNRITLQARLAPLEPGASSTCIVIEVRDNGPGIEEANVARLFDPFFTTKPIGEGTGLGLSICHSIVDAMGGTIGVESTLGEGATFRVRLPTSIRPTVTNESEPRAVSRAGRARVLIVDDEAGFALTLKYLIAEDHDVVALTNPREALTQLTSQGANFDVIFCDLLMPALTGMELFAEVRRKRPELARQFVFMTGGAFTREAMAFVEEIENECLEKPFPPEKIRLSIARVMAASGPAR